MNPYLEEVIALHDMIEALFARGEGSVAGMLKRFHPDFAMVTPAGMQLGLGEVSTLFAQRGGSQPGLCIELTEQQVLAQWPEGAVVSYRETHHVPGQPAKARISTVLFSLQAGQVLWRHLHETGAA
ncbi:DUF4440 domain-containing protein [Pseudomonas sp. CM27]|uniref:DUF4440 domain-containing protein n=1 Tax=Pseudomonas sp. CM27 TaxID=2738452 RepID=UPI001553D216|nr:DUF4440 domain-containing protein [Pseudomonas sp. CM27]NQD77200.1 DUF4440 domain-containing protein [Pseudomonas sp. CM27]HEN8798111.1 DUF4440 domain-containing protein [Pseudomonas putida]